MGDGVQKERRKPSGGLGELVREDLVAVCNRN